MRLQAAFLFLILSLPLSQGQLQADTLFLKNGQTLEGVYLGESKGIIDFKMTDGVVRISRKDIDRMAIGYLPIPLCYRLKGESSKKCDAKLFFFEASKLDIKKGRENPIPERRPLSDFAEIEFRKSTETDRIVPYLKKGIAVRIALTDGTEVKGKITGSSIDQIEITDENGTVIPIKEEMIQKTTLSVNPATQVQSRLVTKLVPGLTQIQRGDRKRGYAIIAGFGLVAGGIYREGIAADRDAARARRDPIYKLTGITARRTSFDRHHKNIEALQMAGALLYGLHIADAFGSSMSNNAQIVWTVNLDW